MPKKTNYVSASINLDQTNRKQMAVLLRIILLASSPLLLAWLVTIVTDKNVYWWVYGLLIFLPLNFIYLLANQPFKWRLSNWRICRLIGLWLDAKESELRQRADRPRRESCPRAARHALLGARARDRRSIRRSAPR